MPTIAKLEAGTRQLNASISLFFEGGDRIAVHTLAVAASNIFADVLDKTPGIESWREKMRIDHGLTKAGVRDVMHGAWNFFKHGDRDPEGILEFDEDECEHLIFLAILECGELQKISIQMQTFQFWYLACGSLKFGPEHESQRLAQTVFPGIDSLCKADQLKIGSGMLAKYIEEFGGDA